MFEETWKYFNKTMDSMSREMDSFFKKTPHKGKVVKVKIRKGSSVCINGARCTLLYDTTVETNQAEVLMKKCI